MRWQEEVTLTGYEMQWTVRYFLYRCKKWELPAEPASVSTRTNLSVGAVAYWNRKKAVWMELAIKADKIFRRCNSAYESPLL
jgi:hypothetical protein